ncbi:MAG TPA: D-amino-acid transaminase, partial [Spirochaetia bacterium]|nr:D-amino-acid transaminase [Spirochaetia bacterium]
MEQVLVNGKIIDRGDARIDIEDRGFQFGDGLYEVIRTYGGKPFLIEEHLKRLSRGAEAIRLSLPFDPSEFTERLTELSAINSVQDGTIYMQITRGVAKRSHQFPTPLPEPTVIASTASSPRPLKLIEEGAGCILAEDIRWLRCDIKSTNLLPNVLAKEEARSKGCFEAIFHRGDIVTEGASSNIFAVRSGVIFTHPANNLILAGITRTAVLGIIAHLGLPVR